VLDGIRSFEPVTLIAPASLEGDGEMASRLKQRQAVENRLKALSHPLRTAIWRVLQERPASLGEIASELGYGRQDIGKIRHHVEKLTDWGCAEEIGERRLGNRLVSIYKAIDRALIETGEWEQFREENPILGEHFICELEQMQIDNVLAALEAGTLGEDEQWHISQTPMVLDPLGVEDALEIVERCRLELAENERRAAERRSESGADAVHAYADLSFFKTPAPAERTVTC
jgi:biotin operon repressor